MLCLHLFLQSGVHTVNRLCCHLKSISRDVILLQLYHIIIILFYKEKFIHEMDVHNAKKKTHNKKTDMLYYCLFGLVQCNSVQFSLCW